ncbi:MAG: DUF1641 domain-containing protein [Crenarchaeota archaeon]|nr:DUF1641 domain-containing protein [Thermoproteota archaeon]
MSEEISKVLEKMEAQKLEELAKAIERLADAVAKLQESGILGMLVAMAEKSEEILEIGLNDRRVHHAMAAADAALNPLEDVDPIVFKENIENLTECALKALNSEEFIKQAKPAGIGGLLKVLRDPDIGAGLGLMLYMAKVMGSCLRKKASE